MKRTLIAVAVLALALPVFAFASSARYNGAIDDGGTMTFKLVKRDGQKKVKGFAWADATINCLKVGQTTYSGTFFTMKVEDGEFQGTGFNDAGTGKVKITGELRRHGKARGTIKAKGTINTAKGTEAGCRTGEDDWHAEKA
jgi:hypothetical protein